MEYTTKEYQIWGKCYSSVTRECRKARGKGKIRLRKDRARGLQDDNLEKANGDVVSSQQKENAKDDALEEVLVSKVDDG